jgi:hypothetical protein
VCVVLLTLFILFSALTRSFGRSPYEKLNIRG